MRLALASEDAVTAPLLLLMLLLLLLPPPPTVTLGAGGGGLGVSPSALQMRLVTSGSTHRKVVILRQ